MDIQITPARLSGTLEAVSSKSYAHRLLVCAGLSDKPTRIMLNSLSDDICATIRCLTTMGCSIESADGALFVEPFINPEKDSAPLFDCGESGATARFLLPLAAHLFNRFSMTGSGRLPGRPFAPLCKTLAAAGCSFDSEALPLAGKGKIQPGKFAIAGNISSQYISGLLFTLPLLDADSSIELSSPLESADYVNMTIETQRLFGITINKCESGFEIKGKQRYQSPGETVTEGDWSNAAFFMCMGALGGKITLNGLSLESAQGDRAVIDILRQFGANVNAYTVTGGKLRGISIDAAQIPDLVPALAVTASAAAGETRIFNAQRLRLKESDRLQSVFDLLSRLGADIRIAEDGLIIRGKEQLDGGIVDSAGDHRIVMAAATASCICKNPVTIRGAEAVNKSYPSFFEHFRALGGNVYVINDGK